MTDHQDKPAASSAAQKIASDEARDKAPNARRHFASPELLVADATLSQDEKLALLKDWELDLSNRLKAEDEGMSVSDPMRGRDEARLADEAARVQALLAEIAGAADGGCK